MELRKKPSFWQRLLETLFRLRLIFLLLSGVLLLLLFFSRNELFSFILAASESFSIKVSSGLNLAELKPYFPLFGGVIAIFIVRFIIGGVFSGLFLINTSFCI
jgi:dolichol kinase